MNSSQRNRIDKVLRNGVIVLTMTGIDKPEFTARLYINSESRGYHTDFQVKHFFYVISFKDGSPIAIEGVTKDSRRKNILNHFKTNKISHSVVNQEYFTEWLN